MAMLILLRELCLQTQLKYSKTSFSNDMFRMCTQYTVYGVHTQPGAALGCVWIYSLWFGFLV